MYTNIIHRRSLQRDIRGIVDLCRFARLIAALDVTKNFLFALNSVNGVRYSTRSDAIMLAACLGLKSADPA